MIERRNAVTGVGRHAVISLCEVGVVVDDDVAENVCVRRPGSRRVSVVSRQIWRVADCPGRQRRAKIDGAVGVDLYRAGGRLRDRGGAVECKEASARRIDDIARRGADQKAARPNRRRNDSMKAAGNGGVGAHRHRNVAATAIIVGRIDGVAGDAGHGRAGRHGHGHIAGAAAVLIRANAGLRAGHVRRRIVHRHVAVAVVESVDAPAGGRGYIGVVVDENRAGDGEIGGAIVSGKNAGAAAVNGGILAGRDRAVRRYRDLAVGQSIDRRGGVEREYARAPRKRWNSPAAIETTTWLFS